MRFSVSAKERQEEMGHGRKGYVSEEAAGRQKTEYR